MLYLCVGTFLSLKTKRTGASTAKFATTELFYPLGVLESSSRDTGSMRSKQSGSMHEDWTTEPLWPTSICTAIVNIRAVGRALPGVIECGAQTCT